MATSKSLSLIHSPQSLKPVKRQNRYHETTRTNPLAPLHGQNRRGNRCGGPRPMDPINFIQKDEVWTFH